MNVREMLEAQPLYTWVSLELPEFQDRLSPDMLLLECWICKAERPFRVPGIWGSGSGRERPKIEHGAVYVFSYECTACKKATFRAWLEIRLRPEAGVRKVGQVPPYSVAIDRDVEAVLGDGAQHLKRAKICVAQGYGLAACAYMRRLLEEEVTPVLQLVLDAASDAGATENSLADLRAVIGGKEAAPKLPIAYRHAPPSLNVPGGNPLKLMHDLLSRGVHALPEEECVQIALQLIAALEFTVVELRRHRDNLAKFRAAFAPASK